MFFNTHQHHILHHLSRLVLGGSFSQIAQGPREPGAKKPRAPGGHWALEIFQIEIYML
jgi:hypothetical protein